MDIVQSKHDCVSDTLCKSFVMWCTGRYMHTAVPDYGQQLEDFIPNRLYTGSSAPFSV